LSRAISWLGAAGARLALVLLVLLVLAAGRASAYLPPPYGGSATVPLADLPVTLDPARASRESELQLVALLHDGLYQLGPDGRPRPHLCEAAPEVSADGKRWRLALRPGVKLSSGRPLAASDVVASLRRARRGPHGHLLAVVRSFELESGAPAAPAALLIHLHRRTPTLPYLLAAPFAAIAVPQRVAGHRSDGRGSFAPLTQFLGSGPFRLHARTATGLQLKANAGHFAGRPYLDELQLTLFERASAEVATFQVGGLQVSLRGTSVFGGRPRHPSSEVESSPSTLVFLGVGRGKPYLADRDLRLALLRGIDRARLGRLASVGRAEIADGPVCARLARPAPPRLAFDRTLANRLLAKAAAAHEALRRDAAQGRLKLSLLVDASRFEDAVVAGQLVADLDRIGIAATVESQPAAEYQARLDEGRFDLVLARQPQQVPLTAAALASALAAGGDRQAAVRCMLGGCGATGGVREATLFMRRLPLVPLVHVGARVFYDARLGQLRLSTLGLVRYADVHWQRRVP
jgi:ABC-type transport system substrate-binding protein